MPSQRCIAHYCHPSSPHKQPDDRANNDRERRYRSHRLPRVHGAEGLQPRSHRSDLRHHLCWPGLRLLCTCDPSAQDAACPIRAAPLQFQNNAAAHPMPLCALVVRGRTDYGQCVPAAAGVFSARVCTDGRVHICLYGPLSRGRHHVACAWTVHSGGGASICSQLVQPHTST